MATTLTFKGSNYTYKVIMPNPIIADSDNLSDMIPLPTATVSPKASSALTRYVVVGNNVFTEEYKIVYAKGATTGTVTRVTSSTQGVRMTTPYGLIGQYCFSKKSQNYSENTFAQIFTGANESGFFDSSSYVLELVANLKPIITKSYTYDSFVNPVFGNVAGLCNFTIRVQSISRWDFIFDGAVRTVPEDDVSYYDSIEIEWKNHSVSNIWNTAHSSLRGVYLSLDDIPTVDYTGVGYSRIRAINQIRAVNDIFATGEHSPWIFPDLQKYYSPTISNLKVDRIGSKNAKIELAYTLDSLNKQSTESSDITINSVTANYQIKNSNGVIVKEGTADIYSEGQSTTSLSNTFSFTTTGDDFDEETSYMAYVWVTDRLGQSSQTLSTILPTDYRTLDFLAGGRGIAMGRVSNEEGFHCAMESRFDDPNIYLANLEDTASIDKTFYDTAIAYGFPSRPPSSVNINLRSYGAWVDSGETVDGSKIYKSQDSWHYGSEWDTAKIEITGYDVFSIYIRSYAQDIYDYILVSAIDSDYLATRTSTSAMRSSYSDTSRTKAYTRGKQSPNEYEKVTFDNLGGTSHYFYIIYQKNGSVDENDDRGYFYLDPKNKPYIDQKKWNFKEMLISMMGKLTQTSQRLDPASDFEVYNNPSAITLRQYGNIVSLTGAVKPKANIAGSGTEYLICTIPEALAPPQYILLEMQGSTNHSWMLRIRGKADLTDTGKVYFSRYRNPSVAAGAYVTCGTGAWLPFHAIWIID